MNIDSIKFIQLIEHELLHSCPVKNKIPKFRIQEQMDQKFYKKFLEIIIIRKKIMIILKFY